MVCTVSVILGRCLDGLEIERDGIEFFDGEITFVSPARPNATGPLQHEIASR
jgi:hypothetical protein